MSGNLKISILLSGLTFISCFHSHRIIHVDRLISTDTVNLSFSVQEAPEWSALFNRNSGWFGADGIFSIPVQGIDTPGAGKNSETILLFSDTMLGEINEGKLEPGFTMINNSVALLKGQEPKDKNIEFYWNKYESGNPKPVFIPKTPASGPHDYYWLGDGFVNGGKENATYIFGFRIVNTESQVFGFKEVGNTLIIIPQGSKPPFSNYKQLDIPFFKNEQYGKDAFSFGAGILVNTTIAGAPNADGYVYIYGVKGGSVKELKVARVLPTNIEDFSKWRFWDGSGWNLDMNNIEKAATITNRVSNELSVTPLRDGRYALVFQTDGIGSSVGLRLGLSPAGPFGPVITLWNCKEPGDNKNFFVYNAKAHPHLSNPGELLISYNVNSFNFLNDIKEYPHLYRPRFLKIKIKN